MSPTFEKGNISMKETVPNQNPAPTKTTSLGIAGLVLGIVAFVTAWIPFVNYGTLYVAGVGLVFAIIAVVVTTQRKRLGKGLSVVALVLNAVALVAVIFMQMLFIGLIYTATAPEEVASVSGQEAGQEVDTMNLKPGQAVKLDNGLKVSVKKVKKVKDYKGKTYTRVKVAYKNTGKNEQSYSDALDWKGENKNGAQNSMGYFTNSKYKGNPGSLDSGTLAAGGKVSGNIYFEGKVVKVLYEGNLLSNKASAAWSVK